MARTLANSKVVAEPVDDDDSFERAAERKLMLDSVMLDPRTADDLRDKRARLARAGFRPGVKPHPHR